MEVSPTVNDFGNGSARDNLLASVASTEKSLIESVPSFSANTSR